jgi:hypothetical protein
LHEHFFQKLSQFSQGNNVLDAAGYNIDAFLWTDTCVSTTHPKSPLWNKQSVCHHRNQGCRMNSFQKVPHISQGNHVLDAPDSNTDCFFGDTYVSSHKVSMPFWKKDSLSPARKTYLQEIFL